MPLDRIEDALAALQRGSMIVVVDDEGRENEGDIILAAQHATPEAIAFMVRYTSGVLCVALPGERLDALKLPLMVSSNTDSMGTAYTVTTDYRHGTTTGISAADRAATIRALVDPNVQPSDFNRPGHVFPLRAMGGGVLQRPGHTEAAVDLTRLAGLAAGGVIAEVVNDDGSMARRAQLEAFARAHGLVLISIADLIAYRVAREGVRCESRARVPTGHGIFTAHAYKSPGSPCEHLAMVLGNVRGAENVLVRVHSECLTGDAFGSLRCDCRRQLDASLAMIGKAGRGVVLYLRGHEGRGIGLANKLRAYVLQDAGSDTIEANLKLGLAVDCRDYEVAARILEDLGIASLRLLTNNPAKYESIGRYGLRINERVALTTQPTEENLAYLMTKQTHLGHMLGIEDPTQTA